MRIVLVLAAAWLALSVVGGLAIGRMIRLADMRPGVGA